MPPTILPSDALDEFIASLTEAKVELYPAQEEALLEIAAGKNIVLQTPTGSGKTLVAEFALYCAWMTGGRGILTCPIKALVNEKFFSLCERFGAEHVGMITGDASVNPDAPIVVCTAEILANFALREGETLPYSVAVCDEFHFIRDRERGWAWEVPLLFAENTQLILMSATLSNPPQLCERLTRLNGRPSAWVHSTHRPVPLRWDYKVEKIENLVPSLLASGLGPMYLVHGSQRESIESAQSLASLPLIDKAQRAQVQKILDENKLRSPFGKEFQRLLKQGIGVHHAGLLPKYRRIVERCAQRGLLPVLCGTDTLGVGINVPIHTVIFMKLARFNGEKMALIRPQDFHQIAGRAGRKGFDDEGLVIAMPPDHVIENAEIDRKIRADPSKARKLTKKKPPDKGYIHYDESTFRKLIESPIPDEPTRLRPALGLLLLSLSRPRAGRKLLRRAIRRAPVRSEIRKQWIELGFRWVRHLLEEKILIFNADGELEFHGDLQEDFTLHHDLALFLQNALTTLGDNEDQSFKILSLAESITEDPEIVLRKQKDRVRQELLAKLKMEGVDFEERMARLEEVEHPKPERELIYSLFNSFQHRHPWLELQNIRPKSIVRELIETGATFNEYIREYGLERSEGVLLRAINEVLKILQQSVPEDKKTEQIQEWILWLEQEIRATDSSLLDEWQSLRDPAAQGPKNSKETNVVVSQEPTSRQLEILLRNSAFPLLRAIARNNILAIQELVALPAVTQIRKEIEEFRAHHPKIHTDIRARHRDLYHIKGSLTGTLQLSITMPDLSDSRDWHLELMAKFWRESDAWGYEFQWIRLGTIG